MNRLIDAMNRNRHCAADASIKRHALNRFHALIRRSARDRALKDEAVFHGAARRRGAIVVEIVICSVMLATVSLILVPALTAVSRQRQEIRFKTLSMTEINNLHQDLLRESTAGKSLKSIAESGLQLSDWFRSRYAEASLHVTLLPEVMPAEAAAESDVPAIQSAPVTTAALVPVRITISRPSGIERPDLTSSLVVWVVDRSDVPKGAE